MTATIDRIKERLTENSRSLQISRVPKNTLVKFKEMANTDDFENDYGFLLKFLMDFYLGLVPVGNEHLEMEIQSLRQEIEQLKQSLVVNEEKKSRRTLLGEKIKGRRGGLD